MKLPKQPTESITNPLLTAATEFYTPLLLLCRNTVSNTAHPLSEKDQRLKQHKRLKQFAQKAKASGYSDSVIKQASIVLAAWADELLSLHYPHWETHRLLNKREASRFNQVRFFNFVNKQQQPDHLAWLELVYVSLSLGFTAGYTPQPHQDNQRDIVIEQLHDYIQVERQRQLGPLLQPIACIDYVPHKDKDDVTHHYNSPWYALLSQTQSWLFIVGMLGIVLLSHLWANQQLTEITRPMLQALEALS